MPRRRDMPMLVLMTVLSAFAGGAWADDDGRLARLIPELAPPPANEALVQIPDTGRKLLALRSYVRAGSNLAKRWSWTDDEIEAFKGSTEQQALLAEIAAVNAHFAEANPGYELYVNSTVRSLDVQIERWNKNESVGVAAAEILAAWEDDHGADAGASGDAGPKELRSWLSAFKGTKRSNLAAPGLTAHGRGHAIDFQVMKDGRIVAGADSRQIETVWRAEKWDVKLKDSMDAAGPSFSGPLTSPNEPWHYDYDPAADTQTATSGD